MSMNETFRVKKQVSLVSMLVLLGLCSVQSAGADPFTKRNGANWFRFGPAVIDGCKRIDVQFGIGLDESVIIRAGDRRFSVLKKWIQKKFSRKLNSTPLIHSYESVQFDATIKLYNSTLGNNGTLLMEIPLSETTLGVKTGTIHNELLKLKRIVK